jgi:pimeloyl-ACP methyl ester carboxylesterase
LANTLQPKTRYAKSGDIHIAYQVNGEGPLDLVCVPGFVSHVEYVWEHPSVAQFFRRLMRFSRVIRFDKRGTGLSDRVTDVPTLEQRMDDVRAVMDAAGSERAALFGVSEGGAMSLLFSATYPERTSALILYGSYARRSWAPEYPFGWTEEDWRMAIESVERYWGGQRMVELLAPSLAHDEGFAQWMANYYRLSASPGAAIAVWKMNKDIDVRHILSAIRVPTLVLHRTGDRLIRVEHARHLAEHIPGAKLVEFPGSDHAYWTGDAEAILDEVEEFLTGARHQPEIDRVLATVLFTDIVGSTEQAAALGDRRWHEVLDGYYALARRELARFRGREIDTAGDGLFAAFDGPARAIRCAMAIATGARPLGIEIRAGLHTGECEMMGEKLGGIAVHIGARVAAQAGPGEVLVSSTVKDLVAGAGLHFQDRGVHSLRGTPGDWRLFAVASADG